MTNEAPAGPSLADESRPALTVTAVSINDPAWLAFAHQTAERTFFHEPAWNQLLADCYGFVPRILVWRDPSNEIVAAVPISELRTFRGRRRWVALPFSDECSIITTGPRPAGFVRAAEVALARYRVGSLEIRWDVPEAGAYKVLSAVRHSIDLAPGPALIQAGLSRTHRGSIRKAERSGVDVVCGRSATAMQGFYALHLRTRRRLGVPIQPARFFRLFSERVLAKEKGFILTALIGERPVAAGVFVLSGRRLLFKYAASDDRYWESRPNHLLAWTAIRMACDRGYTSFDWGRTEISNEGLRRYKLGFGSIEEPLPYSWIGTKPRTMSGSARRSLSLLIQRSPDWVCRLAGELLYRWAT